MASAALKAEEVAILVTAAIRGADEAPRQALAAAVAAALRTGADLLRGVAKTSQDAELGTEEQEEIAARVHAIAPMLAKQVQGQPVCGSLRVARNVACHVGFGEGAQVVRGSVQELRRCQRGERRRGGEEAQPPCQENEYVQCDVKHAEEKKRSKELNEAREELTQPQAKSSEKLAAARVDEEERSKELREARAELAQLRTKSAEELAAARAAEEERRQELDGARAELTKFQAKLAEEMAAARADAEERRKELNEARAELAAARAGEEERTKELDEARAEIAHFEEAEVRRRERDERARVRGAELRAGYELKRQLNKLNEERVGLAPQGPQSSEEAAARPASSTRRRRR